MKGNVLRTTTEVSHFYVKKQLHRKYYKLICKRKLLQCLVNNFILQIDPQVNNELIGLARFRRDIFFVHSNVASCVS